MPLLPLSVCSGPSTEASSSGWAPSRSDAQQYVVEDGELFAGVLEVDRNQLGGDLELHQREPGALDGPHGPVIFSIRLWSSEAWNGFFT